MAIQDLNKLAKLIRYYILISTTEAGSGHPSSSLSGVELMATLMFGGFFRADLSNPAYANNDRLIFSKGHAAPLLYALYAAAGKLSEEELKQLRKFGNPPEGHPSLKFPYTEAPTGSLGQGLSIAVGMALNAKYLDKLSCRVFTLLGDSEMSEGSQWEALQVAAHYKLDNLIAILDVNRLGQRGETMIGHDIADYAKKAEAFGWKAIVVEDGHSLEAILPAYEEALKTEGRPAMIIARTLKGKGVSLMENKDGWHGKALNKEECVAAIAELGEIDKNIRGEITAPEQKEADNKIEAKDFQVSYRRGEMVATRKAYGNALAEIFPQFPEIVVLDAETSNSTYAEIFKNQYPQRFFEMFIAEQNMAGAAIGFSRRGKMPFVSGFAAFLSRAFDQIRMSQYSDANIKFVGSHAGVSIGEDGFSQMGLEDIAMFRSLLDSVVLYPADAVSTKKLVTEMAKHKGVVYLRTSRPATPVLYEESEEFKIGGSKVLRQSDKDAATVIGAGVTLYEALAAYEELLKEGIAVRIIDLYSIKPLNVETLEKAARETKNIIIAEDHFAAGGIGEAVAAALSGKGAPVHILAVRKMPKGGKMEELLDYEEISRNAIIKKVKELR